MMGVQFISYLNLTFNFRAIAHEQYAVIAATDAAAVVISYYIIRKVSKAEGHWGLAGQTIGGSLAGLLGVWLTRTWG
jgi:hypothetical protein